MNGEVLVEETNNNTRRGRKPRRWLPYVAGVVLVGLIVAGLWPRPVPVEIGVATVGPLRASVSEEGKTRIRQKYVISAPVSGRLQRIEMKAGAEVTAGETVVAVLEPLAPNPLDPRSRAQAEARREAAVASLEKARAGAALAASELRRFEQLFEQGTISAQERETAQTRSTTAARDVAQAEGLLKQAEAELAEADEVGEKRRETKLKSPVNGRVLKVYEENAKTVSAGTPLLEVGDPADLEVVVDVLSRDGAGIVPGMRMELDQWGGGGVLEAKVRLVEPAAFTKVSALGVEEQRVNVVGDVLTPVEQRRSLGDNFRVEARIIVWEDGKALKVPAGALFRSSTDWACYVVEGDRAKLRKVKVGRTSGTESQILEGLAEGQRVILYPGTRVKEGQRVTQIEV